MKNILISLFCFAVGLSIYGQNAQNTKWAVSLSTGLQEHDKRLFEFPLREDLLESQPEKFGTFQTNVNILRMIYNTNKFKVNAGTGLGVELNTFRRPFDYTYRRDDDTKILRFTDRYYKYLLVLPLEARLFAREKIFLSSSILTQFNFHTVANRSNFRSYNWWIFNFHSVELASGIGYSLSLFDFALSYRAYQFKKIDRILFNHILRDPRVNKKIETENPFKLWLSIGYRF